MTLILTELEAEGLMSTRSLILTEMETEGLVSTGDSPGSRKSLSLTGDLLGTGDLPETERLGETES